MTDIEHNGSYEERLLYGDELFFTTPFPVLSAVNYPLSRLRYHGNSLLLSSYLYRIKRKNSSCACGHLLQDLTHLYLDCPASEPLRRAILTLLSSLMSGPDLGAWPDCWVSVEFFHTPPLGRGRVAPPPPDGLSSVYERRQLQNNDPPPSCLRGHTIIYESRSSFFATRSLDVRNG